MNKERELPHLDTVRVRIKEMLEDDCGLPDYAYINGDDVIVALMAYDALAAENEKLKTRLEHFELGRKLARDKAEKFGYNYCLQSNVVKKLITALENISENGNIASPNADTLVARLALEDYDKAMKESGIE